MAEYAIHPPVHLTVHPEEPVRSLEAAAAVVRSYAGLDQGAGTTGLLERIEHVSTPEEADAAGNAFRAWAHVRGLLLVPPEDSSPTTGC